jgi:hypothetical protein
MKRYVILAVAALCLIAGAAAASDSSLFTDEKIYKVEASDCTALDQFGGWPHCIAISDDSSTLVVGVWGEDIAATNDGAAYVFTRDECVGWSQAQKLTPTVALADGACFGMSVAVSDDGTYIAIGAPYELNGGAVYVFYYSGGTWSQQQRIPHPSAQALAYFGWSLAISADGSVLAVGSSRDDEEGASSGAVYTYTRSGAVWSLDATVVGDDIDAGSYFGFSLGLSADAGALIVGTQYKKKAYIFDGGWVQKKKLEIASSTFSYGNFVSISSDGLTALVSEPLYLTAVGQPATGAVHVYTSTGDLTSWTLDDTIVPASASDGDEFGYAISISDDRSLILAGSPCANSETGTAYLFSNTTGVWLQEKAWTSPDNPAADDNFGYSGALSSDGNYAAIGCPRGYGATSDAGAVFVSYLGPETVGQALIDYVRYYLYEPEPIVYEDSELLGWLNHGVMDLVSRSQCLQYTEDITLSDGVSSYAVAGDYIHVAGVIYNDAKGLIRGNIESLGNQFHDIGEPNAYVPWEDNVWIYPRPDSDAAGNAITVYGLERPDTMTALSCLEIPEMYVRLLVYYAVAQSFYKVGKFSKAREIMMWYFEEADRLRMDYFTLEKELVAKSK